MTMGFESSSLIDQIVSQTIALLSEQEEFDVRDLEHLEQLLRSEKAAESEQVMDVLCAQEESPE